MTPEEIKSLEERYSELEEKYQRLLQLQDNIKQMKDMEVAGLFKSKKLGKAADVFSRHDLNVSLSPKEAREIFKRKLKELQKEVYELYVDYGVEIYAPWDAYENKQKRYPLSGDEYDKLKNKDQIVFIKNDEQDYLGDLKLCGICLKIFELEINDHDTPLENRSIKDGVYLEHKLVVDNDYGTYPTPVCFRGKIPRDMQDFLNEMKNVSRLRAIYLYTRYPYNRYLSSFVDDLSRYLLEATIARNVDLFSSIVSNLRDISSIVSNLRDTCFADSFSDIYLDEILRTVSVYGTTEMLDTLDNLGFGFDKYRRDSVADIIRLTFDCSDRVNLSVFNYLIDKLPSDSIHLHADHNHRHDHATGETPSDSSETPLLYRALRRIFERLSEINDLPERLILKDIKDLKEVIKALVTKGARIDSNYSKFISDTLTKKEEVEISTPDMRSKLIQAARDAVGEAIKAEENTDHNLRP